MEALTRAIYINVNELQYMFLKEYQSRTNTLNISNDMDMRSVVLPSRCTYAELTTKFLSGSRTQGVQVWIHSHENQIELPDMESGWKNNGEEIEYDLVK